MLSVFSLGYWRSLKWLQAELHETQLILLFSDNSNSMEISLIFLTTYNNDITSNICISRSLVWKLLWWKKLIVKLAQRLYYKYEGLPFLFAFLSPFSFHRSFKTIPDSKVRGTNMGPTWGRQDPGGPHVGPMNLAIWEHPRMVFCSVLLLLPSS